MPRKPKDISAGGGEMLVAGASDVSRCGVRPRTLRASEVTGLLREDDNEPQLMSISTPATCSSLLFSSTAQAILIAGRRGSC